MAEKLDLRTATMAKVLTDQGHFRKAADIYRHLTEQDPESRDYVELLADMENKITQQKRSHDLVALIQEWISLLVKVRHLKYLQQIQAGIEKSDLK